MIDDLGPRPSFTIDFGDVLHTRLINVAETLEITKSELVREAVSYFLDNECYNLRSSKNSKKKIRTSKVEEVKRLVDCYNSIFYSDTTPPKQFYPALYKTYNAAVKGGLSTEDMLELIRVAPYEEFVQRGLREGNPPTLPYLLSQGMIPRLLVVLQSKQQKNETLSKGELVEYKYDIIDRYIDDVVYAQRDTFRDEIMAAQSKSEINKVLKVYA